MEDLRSIGYASTFQVKCKDNLANDFCQELGMAVNLEPVLPPVSARPEQVDKILKTQYHDATAKLSQGKNIDLIITILPDDNKSLYGDLKRICEIEIGVASQRCLTKDVLKMNRQYMANLALKIKAGESNSVTDHRVCWDTLNTHFQQLQMNRLPTGARPSKKVKNLNTFLNGQPISSEDVRTYMGTQVYEKFIGEERSNHSYCYPEMDNNFLLRWISSEKVNLLFI